MLKNMKIGRRLLLGFVVVMLISSISGAMGIALLRKIDVDYSAALVDYGFAQGDVGRLAQQFQRQRATTLYIVNAPNENKRQEHIQTLKNDDATLDLYLENVRLGLATDQGRAVYSEIDAAIRDYKSNRDAVIVANATIKGEAIQTMVAERCGPISNKVVQTIDNLLNEKSSVGAALSVDLSKQTVLFLLLMGGIIAGAAVIAIVFALIIARGISRPIQQVEKVAEEMAKGNYDHALVFESKDEIGSLAKSMRSMMQVTKGIIEDASHSLTEIGIGNFDIHPQAEYIGVFARIRQSMEQISASLSTAMIQINQASEQVASGSDQVSSGAQALSQGATEQASSIEELSATINEISSQVRESAEHANTAKHSVEVAGGAVSQSNQQMQRMIAAMSDIGTKSTEISKIIKTIDDIAFQTNILALNAAVEAARAGSAGKGFAVVADEVRNLAGKSAEAAKNTTALIEQTVDAVAQGSKIAGETATAMMSVVEGNKTITGLISKISHAANEQANAISQVTTGLDQISGVVQTNSATAEESAAASEELSSQAQLLKDLVGQFKVRPDTNALSAPVQHHRQAPTRPTMAARQSTPSAGSSNKY